MVTNTFQYNIQEGFLWSEVNLKGDKKFFIEGYASTIDLDKAGEILSTEAQSDMYNQIVEGNITLDIEHNDWYDEEGKLLPRPRSSLPVAKIVSADLRPQGVWVKAEINQHNPNFSNIWNSIKNGFLHAFSVAFYPVAKAGNMIRKVNLINITLTGSPVNPNATFSATLKSAKAYLDSIEKTGEPQMDSQEPSIKLLSEEKNMAEEKEKEFQCKECEKEFPNKEALDNHYEEAHEKKDNEAKAEPEKGETEEHEKKESKETEKEESKEPEEKAKVKAEIESLKAEIKALKAELEKPVLKSLVEETPKVIEQPVIKVTPFNLIK